jgi:hypothetical protein
MEIGLNFDSAAGNIWRESTLGFAVFVERLPVFARPDAFSSGRPKPRCFYVGLFQTRILQHRQEGPAGYLAGSGPV